MRPIQSPKKGEPSPPAKESASVRQPWPQPRTAIPPSSNEGPMYRFFWRRGPRRPRHDRTWGHLSRNAGVVLDVATREASVTADSCGVATLVVEAHGERTQMWRNWRARHYPFVSALLEELGKPNPFRSSPALPAASKSAKDSYRGKRVSRRDRSIRS